jgi:predicted secreted protein
MTETRTASEHAVPGVAALHRTERRRPGQLCIDRSLAARAGVPRSSALRRALGASPIGVDEREVFEAARGERLVGRALDGLPTRWIVFHSLPCVGASGDIDHIVVGPAGLFALTTRSITGDRVVVAEDELLSRGERIPFGRSAAAATRRTARLAGAALPAELGVRSVLVVAGARAVRLRIRARSIEVCDARSVRAWLESLPPVLDDDDVRRIGVRIAAAFEADADPLALAADATSTGAVRASLFARLEREVDVARRLRVLWRGVGCAVLAVGLWASFTQLPAVLAGQVG